MYEPFILLRYKMSENNLSSTIENNQQIRFVAHEIRNHLSVCDMYSQIIKKNIETDGYDNPSVNNALVCIQKSLQIIAMNIMDLKSINLNTQTILDFKSCILRAVELSKAYVDDKDIEFEVFIKNSTNIKIDENRLVSCVVNIIEYSSLLRRR